MLPARSTKNEVLSPATNHKAGNPAVTVVLRRPARLLTQDETGLRGAPAGSPQQLAPEFLDAGHLGDSTEGSQEF